MDETNTGNQAINGNDANASGATQPQYTDTEKQLYTRLKKEETLRKELEAKLNTQNGQSSQQTNVSDMEWRERMEIKLTHGIKDDSQLDFIMKNGGKTAIETDPYVRGALQKAREDAEIAEKVSFNTSPKASIEQRFTSSQIASMSVEEMEKALNGGTLK